MLQREGCIIYSFGSLSDFSFEQETLARTKCEIHVFDPTVKPSDMRAREALLNGDGPKRVTWHSVGVSNVDEDASACVPPSPSHGIVTIPVPVGSVRIHIAFLAQCSHKSGVCSTG